MSWEEYLDWYYRLTVNWHECNVFCKSYLTVSYLNLLLHWGINMIQLRGWAEGNILLLANTWYTTVMTIFSTILTLGAPSMMMAPRSTRVMIFSFSCISVVALSL